MLHEILELRPTTQPREIYQTEDKHRNSSMTLPTNWLQQMTSYSSVDVTSIDIFHIHHWVQLKKFSSRYIFLHAFTLHDPHNCRSIVYLPVVIHKISIC